MRSIRWVLVAVLMLSAPNAFAMFRAADLVVIPVAAANPGLNNTSWHTDLEIINPAPPPAAGSSDSGAIDVMIVFLPSGFGSNRLWFNNFENHLGGRATDGFSKVDEHLKDIAPGTSVVITNIIEQYWNNSIKGALLIYAYKAGTYPPAEADRRPVLASARTYTTSTDGEGNVSTYGQYEPGVPWWSYIDPHGDELGVNRALFPNIVEDASFRTAIGLFNFSDPQTTIEVDLQLKSGSNELLARRRVFLGALEHRQFDQAVRTLFSIDATATPSLTGAVIEVSIASWTSNAPDAVMTPALIAYVTRTDNRTNDPVYIEQMFPAQLPADCVFEGEDCPSPNASALGFGGGRRRPLTLPTR